MLAKEISVIKKIRMVSELKFNESRSKSICQIVDYGILVMTNFDKESEEGNGKLVGYYMMPEYRQDLYQFLLDQ